MYVKHWYGLIGLLIGSVFVLAIHFFGGLPCKEAAACRDKAAAMTAQIADQRNTIIAYQRALIGEERDLLSMYDSVNDAGQVDIIVHTDTDSGLPLKFNLACSELKQ